MTSTARGRRRESALGKAFAPGLLGNALALAPEVGSAGGGVSTLLLSSGGHCLTQPPASLLEAKLSGLLALVSGVEALSALEGAVPLTDRV